MKRCTASIEVHSTEHVGDVSMSIPEVPPLVERRVREKLLQHLLGEHERKMWALTNALQRSYAIDMTHAEFEGIYATVQRMLSELRKHLDDQVTVEWRDAE